MTPAIMDQTMIRKETRTMIQGTSMDPPRVLVVVHRLEVGAAAVGVDDARYVAPPDVVASIE